MSDSLERSQPFPSLSADVNEATEEQNAQDNAYPEEDFEEERSVPDEVNLDDDADVQSHYSADNQSCSEDSSDSEGQAQEEDIAAMRHPFRFSTGSLQGFNAFAPPFYNRPPTPLPPSPSLTSLLRPPFSTTTSRPTTPDSSDVETPNDTEAAVAKSARQATTVPRASPKVPTYEYYGFVLYLTSSLAFCK